MTGCVRTRFRKLMKILKFEIVPLPIASHPPEDLNIGSEHGGCINAGLRLIRKKRPH
jgi:hypothetical protein